MKINLIYFFICGSILLGTSQNDVTIVEVSVSNNVFTPADIVIDIGDKVTWTRIGGFHNVDGSTDTYPDNPDSFFSGPASSSWDDFSHTFTVPGEYVYQCNPHASMGMVGTITVSALSIDEVTIPNNYSIYSIYPNPFNPVTKITYGLREYSNVKIAIFDLSGKRVATLINKFQSSGYHSIDWNADNHASGIYFIKMITDEYINTKKIILFK